MPKMEAINWRLVTKSSAHISSVRTTFSRKPGYYRLLLLEVTMYSYHKWYAKNGSHILTANFQVNCTYKLRKKFFNPGYYRLLFIMVSMYSTLITPMFCCNRLPCILTTSCMPKTEAAYWRLMFKCTAHNRSVKIPSMVNQVTRCYCC